MNVVFMGTPDFAVPTLEKLYEKGYNVQCVFSQPDKPKGRGYKLSPPPVKVTALAHETEVLQPVYAYALRVAAPECQSLSILDTKLSKEKVDNAWQEVWVVKACSKKAAIPINFTIQEDKTEYAIDPMGVKVKDKVPGMVITK